MTGAGATEVAFPAAGEPTAYRALLDAVVAGRTPEPPYVTRLGFPRISAWSHGGVRAELVPPEDLVVLRGAVFGGYVACLVDQFAGLATMTLLPDDHRFATVALATSFASPLRARRCEVAAEVTELTPERASCAVSISQDGRVTSTGTATQAILPLRR